jgi:uncharacterized membrane protein YphA (DoxX/SURF4 family)
MTMILRIIHWLCRCVLAGIFLYTGYIKIRAPLQFAAVLSGYQLFPDSLILPMADYFPWVEIALGVLLLVGWKIRYVAVAACALLAAFLTVLTITYFRGIDANCGCFSFEDRISLLTLGRDTLILLPALFLAFSRLPGSRSEPTPVKTA